MQPERWQDCLDIFSDVVDRPHNARGAFLDHSCNGDQALRRDVELLLKYHDESGDFIDTPAFVAAPELLIDDPSTLLGQQLGRYRIDALLGAGGMGVVYLATDLRLGRKVGLKLLPQSLLADKGRWELLKHEARTASALNHPNIMTIHEVDETDSTHYIATEFIEGSTLRERINQGPIPPDEAIEIVTQVARALCVAHAAGIVHRDIKPENIMLRPDGYVKVLDFGIAKFVVDREALGVETISGTNLTIFRGRVRGTAGYMSPEQANNQTVDARSDLWSLGVVLYEMLAAHAPFEGEGLAEVMAAVVHEEPRPVSERVSGVPVEVQRIVDRALKKEPNERYQTAEELLSELRPLPEKSSDAVAAEVTDGRQNGGGSRWFRIAVAVVALLVTIAALGVSRSREVAPRVTSPALEKGIAVLPFENLGAEPTDRFFADSVQDDILTGVSKVKTLKVIARASVMEYGGSYRQRGKIREIGRALGISHVLEGSVRRVTDRVVISVALIDTRDERQVWSQRYERTLADAISLQGELAIEIARELRATITPAEATIVTEKPTRNADAYLLYLRARELEIAACSRDQLLAATAQYQKAVDLDSAFALARARLSLCASQAFYGDATPEWRARARAEAEEALRLRPDLGEAHLAMAHCYLWQEDNYNRALEELNRTAEMLPNSAEVPLTTAFIYKRQNKFSDRLAALQRAESLDPRNRRVLGYLNNTFRWIRNWPEALQAFDRNAAVGGEQTIPSCRWSRAQDEFQLTGDIHSLKNALAKEEAACPKAGCNWLDLAHYETAMLERDYAAAARFLSTATFRDLPDCMLAHTKAFHEALLAVATNTSSKQQALELARIETEKRLDISDETKPGADLAVLYAFLGRKEEAIRLGEHAIETSAEPTDSIEKSDTTAALAMVYAQTGEPDKAIDLIEHLLTVPVDLQRGAVYNMTLTDLKWRWEWDPLRSSPRFQKLLAMPEPRTIY